MGCNESKSSVIATGTTIAPYRKPPANGAAPIDEPRKIEESAAVPPEEKGLESGADVKEGTQDAEKEDGTKEVADNVEGSTTKEAELVAPTPMADETMDPAEPKQANPQEK